VVVLVCYLDDSGSDPQVPAITIAGYIAAIGAWEEFEPPARALLDREQIDYLHGKLFHHNKGPFKGWGQTKKLEFVTELYDLLRPQVLVGVAFSAIKEELKRRNAETGLNRHTSAYGFAFLALANMILTDPGLRSWVALDGWDVSFIVEEGHRNDGDLVRVFGEVKRALERQDGIGHKMKSISFVDKKSCTAVQMADFLAYHVTRRISAIEKNDRRLDRTPRTPIMEEMIRGIRHISGTATHFWE
jgi:hypothetical protein